jgi:hypothetical protein
VGVYARARAVFPSGPLPGSYVEGNCRVRRTIPAEAGEDPLKRPSMI